MHKLSSYLKSPSKKAMSQFRRNNRVAPSARAAPLSTIPVDNCQPLVGNDSDDDGIHPESKSFL